jgi:hypothetical protein
LGKKEKVVLAVVVMIETSTAGYRLFFILR